MQNTAEQQAPGPVLEYGTAAGMVGDRYIVRAGRGELTARQALGCVVRPETGDRVLLSVDGAGEAWVLAVLSRPEPGRPTEVVLPGDVRLHAEQGELSLSSRTDVTVAAGKGLHLASDRVDLSARRAEVRVEKTRLLGRVLSAQIKRVRCVGDSVESVFRRATQRLKDSFRFVAEHDEVQAGSSRRLVEETLTVHAKNEIHMAEDMVKMDADQVHLG